MVIGTLKTEILTLTVTRWHRIERASAIRHTARSASHARHETFIAVFMISAVSTTQRGLQARVRDSLSPETAFGLQYRRRGSCHPPVFIWRPRISGRRSSGMVRVTAQCHLRAVSLFIPATSENFSVSATTAWITLITESWS